MQRLKNVLIYIKGISFQFLFILQYNSFNEKTLNVIVQLFQLISLVYLYINPIYDKLSSLSVFQNYLTQIYPNLIFIVPQQKLLPSFLFLTTSLIIVICLVGMKLFIGYQYALILILQIVIVAYPILFVKFIIQTINLISTNSSFQIIGVIVSISNLVGTIVILHFFDKKYKLLDILPIILIYFKVTEFAVLPILLIKICLSHYIANKTLVSNLRIALQSSLFIIVVMSFWVADSLVNYIYFAMLALSFIYSNSNVIYIDYHENQTVFFYLQNFTEDQYKLKFFQIIQQHRIDCINITCKCRFIANIKDEEQLLKKAYQLVEYIYKSSTDFESKVQLGRISAEKYDYSLSGLIQIFQLQHNSLYQEYKTYYVKTTYQQQFRKSDKNYTFGQQYFNAFQDLRSFQQNLEDLTIVIKKFWGCLLEFDGSKKFLSMIIDISKQINMIKSKYEIFSQKYEQYTQFKYLFKTFEIVILNILGHDINTMNGQTFGDNSKQIQIKAPQRMLFFVSSEGIITNCNRDFSNIVEVEKDQLIGHSYLHYIPSIYADKHPEWVQNFYSVYNKQETKQTYKALSVGNGYIKIVKMSNKIMPRFNVSIQVITFITFVNNLQYLSKVNQHEQQGKETFFSFLIEKETLKIAQMDESFFSTNKIKESLELRKNFVQLKITDVFPKFTLNTERDTKESSNQVILSYTKLEQLLKLNAVLNNNTLGRQILQSRIPPAFENIRYHQQPDTRKFNRRNSVFADKQSIKQISDQVFMYEVIQQLNIGLSIPYCIVNFKLKSKIQYDHERRNGYLKRQEQKKGHQQKFFKQRQPNQQHQNQYFLTENHGQNKDDCSVIEKKQSNLSNTDIIENFDSKKFAQKNQNQKAEKQELQKTSKSFCLGWLMICPLIVVHIVYMNIQTLFQSTMVYIQQCFNYYEAYEYQLLRQLEIPLLPKNITYVQDLKKLWMQGYGFFENSILVFSKPNDEDFIQSMYQQMFKTYHISIYNNIQTNLNDRTDLLLKYYWIIIVTLSVFFVYLFFDFVFNMHYATRTYKKVTQIILIFLNIDQNDINIMTQRIQKYQISILQMYDFSNGNLKYAEQIYKLDFDEVANNGQISVIGLMKNNDFLETESISPASTQKLIKSERPDQNLLSSNDKKNRKRLIYQPKMKLDDLKTNFMAKNDTFGQDYNSNSNIMSHGTLLTNRSSQGLVLNSHIKLNNRSNFMQSNRFMQQDDEILFPQQEKKRHIQRFKTKYTEKSNEIQQNLRAYIMLLSALLIGSTILGIAIVIIPNYIRNLNNYSQIYFQIRAMPIILFKELMMKVTSITIPPQIGISVYNKNFVNKVQDQLRDLPIFQAVWSDIYQNSVCRYIQNSDDSYSCINLDNSITQFGQKVISQFLQQSLRVKKVTQLFNDNNTALNFLSISRIHLDLIQFGQKLLFQSSNDYMASSFNSQFTLCCVGTVIFILCIFLSYIALNQIKSKINDGQNLLLIVPEQIKSKYIEKSKANDIYDTKQNLNKTSKGSKLKKGNISPKIIQHEQSGHSFKRQK